MAFAQELDPEVVLSFMFQQLSASNEFKAIFASGNKLRLWQEHQIPGKPVYPFCVYKSDSPQTILWQLKGGSYVGKQESEAEVEIIKMFSQRDADWRDPDFRNGYKAITKALGAVCCVPVLDENDERIGTIFQSSYVRVDRRPHLEGDKCIAHYSVVINVIHL